MVWWQSHNKLLLVCDAMDKWGGSFVKSIAAAYRLGDATNRLRLVVAFLDYFKEYHNMRNQHPGVYNDNE